MTTLTTTVRNRRVEIDVPDDWPDGTPVRVTTAPAPVDDGPMTPEEIAALVARMEAMEPDDSADAMTVLHAGGVTDCSQG